MTKRTFNFNVAMNTSVRGRGKWGDFIVALIPLSWCCNILINSNFILRMIEWQNETSLFTIRIQGKQWYWVYKYDPNTALAVRTTPRNIGHNRWRVTGGQESYNADTYYQAIHLAAHLEFQDSYSKFLKKAETHKKDLTMLGLSNEKVVFQTNWLLPEQNNHIIKTLELDSDFMKFNSIKSEQFVNNSLHTDYLNSVNISTDDLTYSHIITAVIRSTRKTKNIFSANTPFTLASVYKNYEPKMFAAFFFNPAENSLNFNAYYDFLQLDETSDADSNTRHHLTTQPFRLIKGVLNQHVTDILQDVNTGGRALNKLLFLNTKFSNSGESLKDKELLPETLWGFRQKKYKRMKKFKFKPAAIYDPVTFEVIGLRENFVSPNVEIAGIELINTDSTSTRKAENDDVSFKTRTQEAQATWNYRLASRINRHRSELVPVTLARRLLRTKRTLVLPAHVNLTVITNSYDVVHSWFVPGLGLKMDCVPGRSTHHTFYIDNIGFYYGQCAEICGRYHHHMPIRICALPFEHFVVWWQSKGIARMERTSEISENRFLQKKFDNPITKQKLVYRMN